MENNNLKFIAHIALIAMTIIYAYNYYVSSAILNKISGFELTILRSGFAAIVFTIIDAIRLNRISKPPLVENPPKPRELYGIIFIASLFMSLSQVLFFIGLKATEPINASIMRLSTPIIVFLIVSVLSLKAILNKKQNGFIIQMTGVVIAVLGAYYTISINYNSNSILTLFQQSGDFIVLLSAALFGIYIILTQKLIKKGYHFVSLLKWNFIIGTCVLFILGFSEMFDYSNIKTLTLDLELSFVLQVSYLLFLATILTFMFNTFALKVLSPTVVSIYNCLQPVVAVIIGFSLGQKIDNHLIVTGFLVILGVIMVSQSEWIGTRLFLIKKEEPIPTTNTSTKDAVRSEITVESKLEDYKNRPKEREKATPEPPQVAQSTT